MDYEKRLFNAVETVKYFQDLVESNGATWLLGLYMAQEWVRLLKDTPADLESITFFSDVLEAERTRHGSGWVDICGQVRDFLCQYQDQRR